MGSFGVMLRQLFAAITAFASAFEKVGKGMDNLGTWVDESSAAFADEARIQRQIRGIELEHDRQKKLRELADLGLDVADVKAKSAKATKAIAAPA